jgi:hypothetical protein
VHSSLPLQQADFFLPSQSAHALTLRTRTDQLNQDEDDDAAGNELFRSESEPRFFGFKKAAISGLISTLRGPPGKFKFYFHELLLFI